MKRRRRLRSRRAVFLLPAALTLGNIFLGFFSVVQALEGRFFVAATCLVAAAILDKFDGLVARRMDAASDFGRELDSLADVVSFGMAPATLAYVWGLNQLPKLGWATAFVFLMCASIRLARFNVQDTESDRRFFVGLPTPAAAGVPVSFIFCHSWHVPAGLAEQETFLAVLLCGLMLLTAFLMVSQVRYFSFKDLDLERRRRHWALLAVGLTMVALAAWPAIVLPAAALAYLAHGPVMRLTGGRRTQPSTASLETAPAGAALDAEPAAAVAPSDEPEESR
ncbi:MAG: CDP-diacylglycerol--serine O-phosphatidyltransferase [Acidobacteriota bacterium]